MIKIELLFYHFTMVTKYLHTQSVNSALLLPVYKRLGWLDNSSDWSTFIASFKSKNIIEQSGRMNLYKKKGLKGKGAKLCDSNKPDGMCQAPWPLHQFGLLWPRPIYEQKLGRTKRGLLLPLSFRADDLIVWRSTDCFFPVFFGTLVARRYYQIYQWKITCIFWVYLEKNIHCKHTFFVAMFV